MSDEFDNLDEREKAAVEGALDRCRAIADQIDQTPQQKARAFR
jgi:hypothetical protein